MVEEIISSRPISSKTLFTLLMFTVNVVSRNYAIWRQDIQGIVRNQNFSLLYYSRGRTGGLSQCLI